MLTNRFSEHPHGAASMSFVFPISSKLKRKKGKNILILILIFSFFIFHSTVCGDSLSTIPLPPLDLPSFETLLTPTRISEASLLIPARFIIITKEEIFSMGAQDLGDVFSHIPGAHVGSFGYLGKPRTLFLRGSSSEDVLYLLDGIPINNMENGDLDLSLIPLNWIERIEVLLEGCSSLYGEDAMGGVVNIITKGDWEGFDSDTPQSDLGGSGSGRPYSRVGLGRGSFDSFRTEFEFGRGIGKKHQIYLTGDLLNTDGFQNGEFKLQAGSAKWRIEPLKGWKSTLAGNHFQGNYGVPSTDSLVNHRSLLRLHLQKDWEKVKSTVSVYYRDEKEKGEGESLRNLILGSESLNQFSSFLLGVGGETRWEETTGLKEDQEIKGWALIMNEWEVLPLLRVSPQWRGDFNSEHGIDFSPKVSLGYTPSLYFHLFASVGQSFRSPPFKENLKREPLKYFSSSLGAQYHTDYWQTGFSLFRTESMDSNEFFIFRNDSIVGIDTVIQGIEGEIETEILEPFAVRGYGILLSAEDEEMKKDLPYRPQFQGGWVIQYRESFLRGNFGLELLLSGEYVGERMSESGERLDDYHLLHSRGEIRIVDFALYAKVINLFDSYYRSRMNFPLPGRTLHVGLSWEFFD